MGQLKPEEEYLRTWLCDGIDGVDDDDDCAKKDRGTK